MTVEDPLVRAVQDELFPRLHPAIVNHSVRVFVFAQSIADLERVAVDVQALHVAALFHDAGTAQTHDGPHRFEIEGADAAAAFLTRHSWEASRVDAVWEAIALHTSPQIAERRGPLTRYLRLGVRTDFGDQTLLPHPDRQRGRAEALHPRLGVEQVLADAVIQQALRDPSKAPPASWPGALLQAHEADPGRAGLNPAF